MKNLENTVNIVCQLSKILTGRFVAKPGDFWFIPGGELTGMCTKHESLWIGYCSFY